MHSSISNSKNSNKSWVYTWLLIIVICLSCLGAYEYGLKKQGFKASITNSKDLWSWHRGQVYHDKQVVLLGASRSQIDIDMGYLNNRFPSFAVTQLSINGNYPVATLKALAKDEKFTGIVIVSMNAQVLESKYLDMQNAYNTYYQEESTLYKSLDAYLTASIDSHFRFLHPSLGLEELVKHYDKKKSFPDVFYTTANLDQSITTDYSKTDTVALLKHFVTSKEKNYVNDPPTQSELWKPNIKILNIAVKKINNRGGKVVFVRFPTDKGHWELDEQYYPRQLYWKKLEQEPLLNTLHFKDIKGLDKFDLPDSSHLDSKDAQAFTRILFDQIILDE
jgi:hypothetical protein